MATLVTGAGGFIGLNLVEALLGDGETVVALDTRPLPAEAIEAFAPLPGTLVARVGDVLDTRSLADAFDDTPIERVIHGAAITLGPRSALAPLETVFDVNVTGTAALLTLAAQRGVRRFVYPSSTAVYGDAPFAGAPVDESVPARPSNAYGYSKLAAERLVLRAPAESGFEVVIARLTAAFGAWEHATGVRETLSPPLQLARAALSGQPIVLAEGGARDWTSGPELGRALARLAVADALPSTLYNLSLGETWHPRLLADALAAVVPGLEWSVSEPTTLDYNDRLDAVRAPIDAGLAACELGIGFSAAPEAARAYAGWVIAHREWLAG